MKAFFSQVNKGREFGATVLVGTHTVRLSVFERLPEKKARVFFSATTHLQRQAHRTNLESHLASALYRLLHDFESSMRKAGHSGATPQDIFIFYAPPVAVSATSQVRVQASEKTPELDGDVLASLIADAEKEFRSRVKNEAKAKGMLTYELETIERNISQTLLDGYPVTSYFSRPFREFSARVSLTGIPKKLAGKLSDACHSIFRESKVYHRECVSAVLSAVARTRATSEHFLCAIVFPDISVLALSQKGHLVGQVSFENDGERMALGLSRLLASTKITALSYARLFAEGKLHGESESHFRKALGDISEKWTGDALQACSELSESLLLPKTIYVVPSGTLDGTVLKNVPADRKDSSSETRFAFLPKDIFKEILESSSHASMETLDNILVMQVVENIKLDDVTP